MPTSVYKVVLLIVDHDGVGPDGITRQLENCNNFANRCINPCVVTTEKAEVEWSDDHPLNQRAGNKLAEMDKLFPPVAIRQT